MQATMPNFDNKSWTHAKRKDAKRCVAAAPPPAGASEASDHLFQPPHGAP